MPFFSRRRGKVPSAGFRRIPRILDIGVVGLFLVWSFSRRPFYFSVLPDNES